MKEHPERHPMRHPPEPHLIALAAGELEAAPAERVERHLRRCPRCRARLAAARRALDALAALPAEAAPPADRWPEIERRLDEPRRPARRRRAPRWSAPRWSAPALIAAALALFVLGAAAGRLTAPQARSPLHAGAPLAAPVGAPPSAPDALAADVQRTGTQYVQAVAALGAAAGRAPARELAQGRDAALAALYGAARELAALAPAEPAVSDLVGASAAARYGEARQLHSVTF